MSLIDLFKEFHSQAVVYAYPMSARALYFTLLGDFNAAYFPEERVYSERELSRLTGLTPTTVHRTLKFLADRGHIKTKATKRGTVIILNEAPVKHERSTDEAPAKQSEGIPNIRARKDVKTLDVKTKSREDARTRELSEIWADEMHRPLGASERYELAELEEVHGYDKVKNAIIQTRHSRAYASFDDFKRILRGNNNERTDKTKRDYEQPDTANDPDWRSFND